MIKIFPDLTFTAQCPYCRSTLNTKKIIWQGIHICYEAACENCKSEIVGDLPVGHATTNPHQIDINKQAIFAEDGNIIKFLGKPLLDSLLNPKREKIEIVKNTFRSNKTIIILNCIDFLYGHCLLKLLNAQRHLEDNPELGLVIIAPQFLEWMLPDGIAESWIVDLSLRDGKNYSSYLNDWINKELERFETVYLSEAYSHPSRFDITNFTKVKKHDFSKENIQIAFIWREDRIWFNIYLAYLLKTLKLNFIGLIIQNLKIQLLFRQIKKEVPNADFVVIGFGIKTKFAEWIKDLRTNKFEADSEKKICTVYSDTRLVIGVHGSNMLLPSAHAGMTIDLMPERRWANFAQDILYHEDDIRLAAFRYRFTPLSISTNKLSLIALSMIDNYKRFKFVMTVDIERVVDEFA